MRVKIFIQIVYDLIKKHYKTVSNIVLMYILEFPLSRRFLIYLQVSKIVELLNILSDSFDYSYLNLSLLISSIINFIYGIITDLFL